MKANVLPRMPLGVVLALAAALAACGEASSRPEPEPPRPGSLSGVVGDGVRPLPGVEIATEPTSGFAVTGAQGAYRLDGVAPGVYTVKATRAGHAPARKEGVTLAKGGSALVDFTLKPLGGSIAGVVTDGVKGALLAGALVSSGAVEATSAADGAYRLEVVAGTHAVRATRAGYLSAERSVSVPSGGAALVDFALAPVAGMGAIAGKVTDKATRKPIAGASLETQPAAAKATSAADGAYRLADLPAGSYKVLASADGYQALTSRMVQVGSGATASVDLQLEVAVVYESTCAECHLNTQRLLADLAIDPPPEPHGEAGSTGEG